MKLLFLASLFVVNIMSVAGMEKKGYPSLTGPTDDRVAPFTVEQVIQHASSVPSLRLGMEFLTSGRGSNEISLWIYSINHNKKFEFLTDDPISWKYRFDMHRAFSWQKATVAEKLTEIALVTLHSFLFKLEHLPMIESQFIEKNVVPLLRKFDDPAVRPIRDIYLHPQTTVKLAKLNCYLPFRLRNFGTQRYLQYPPHPYTTEFALEFTSPYYLNAQEVPFKEFCLRPDQSKIIMPLYLIRVYVQNIYLVNVSLDDPLNKTGTRAYYANTSAVPLQHESHVWWIERLNTGRSDAQTLKSYGKELYAIRNTEYQYLINLDNGTLDIVPGETFFSIEGPNRPKLFYNFMWIIEPQEPPKVSPSLSAFIREEEPVPASIVPFPISGRYTGSRSSDMRTYQPPAPRVTLPSYLEKDEDPYLEVASRQPQEALKPTAQAFTPASGVVEPPIQPTGQTSRFEISTEGSETSESSLSSSFASDASLLGPFLPSLRPGGSVGQPAPGSINPIDEPKPSGQPSPSAEVQSAAQVSLSAGSQSRAKTPAERQATNEEQKKQQQIAQAQKTPNPAQQSVRGGGRGFSKSERGGSQ